MVKIIRDTNHNFIVSNDNWKTFKVLERQTIDAEEELDRDIITEVKIRNNLGEEKGKLIIDELKKIRKMINEAKGNGYGLSFEVFSIATIYDINYKDTIDNYIVTGDDDGKVDAIYWDLDRVYLYQIKLDYLSHDYRRKIRANYIEFRENLNIEDPDCKDLEKYLKKNYEKIKDKECKIITISNNGENNNYKPIDIMEKFFLNKMLPHENNITLALNVPKDRDSEENISILLSSAKEEVYAFFCNAKYLIDTLINVDGIGTEDDIYKYFCNNVRGFIGINEQIVSTIKNEPKNFSKYNNGITITGKVTYEDQIGRIIIKNPIISNGQQTIWNLLKCKDIIDEVNLLIIVKNDNVPSIADKIARYTNTQRNITSVDLLSLDKNIRKVQEQIFTNKTVNNEIFLDINTSGKKPYGKMAKDIYGKYGIITLKDFCKLYYGSIDKKIGSWKSSVSKNIEDLFKNGVKRLDEDRAIKACKIIKKANSFIDNIDEKDIKNDLRSSDLAFMYLMFTYSFNELQAYEIIKIINNKYYYNIPSLKRKSKLIDLYKSNNIINMIEEEIEEFRVEENDSLVVC